MSEEETTRQWTIWDRPEVGRYSIAHLLKETKNQRDITICGMKYGSNVKKITGALANQFKCADCEKGEYNPSERRRTVPGSQSKGGPNE